MIIYKLAIDSSGTEFVIHTDSSGKISGIPFDPANTDYQQFLQHLAQGLPVEAVDGTAMTESEIAALYQTLTQPGT